jgi:hypothetical protein
MRVKLAIGASVMPVLWSPRHWHITERHNITLAIR